MDLPFEVIIFYLLLIDSILANYVSWGGEDTSKWYKKYFRLFSRYFPADKGWTTYYLILVLFMGIILYRTNLLVF